MISPAPSPTQQSGTIPASPAVAWVRRYPAVVPANSRNASVADAMSRSQSTEV